jgi:hypothetical protein
MITFKQFLLLEGGNVTIDDQEADRIDLSKLNRTAIVKKIDTALHAINTAFKKSKGKPIWTDALFASKKFLSGSAFHFFSKTIDDETFKKHKGSVGDIDTQVDKNLEAELKDWLTANKGKTFGPVTLIGFKTSAGQHISLWKLKPEGINVQIDLEMVDFGEDDQPTEWANFSHSSAWEDMTQGIKGVAHKYLLRALDAPKLKDIVLKAKTARGTDKEMKSSETAFSVTHGVRKKLKPVLDDSGKQVVVNGKPAYHEMDTKESKGDTNLANIFKNYFGRDASADDIKKLGSFTGMLSLINKTFKDGDKQKITDGFARTLWGPQAQGLYKGDPEKDSEEKNSMMKLLNRTLGTKDNFDSDRKTFYAAYK